MSEDENGIRSLLDSLPIGIFECDKNGTIKVVNSTIEKITGFKKEELLGKSIRFFLKKGLNKDIQAVSKASTDKALPIGELLESSHTIRINTKDGSTIDTLINTSFKRDGSGRITGLTGVISDKAVDHDILEIDRTKAALSEAYDIINKSSAVVFLWRNAEGWPVQFVSENVAEVFGYTAEDFTSGSISYIDVIYPDDLDRMADEVSNYATDTGRDRFTHSPYRIVTKKGDIIWVEDRTYVRRDAEKQITHFQGIVEDITVKKIISDELKLERERLKAALEAIPGYVYLQRPDFTITFTNSVFRELFGDPRGRHCYEVIHNRTEPCQECPSLKVFEKKRMQEWEWTSPDERKYMVFDSHFSDIDGSPLVLELGIDITERRNAQEALKRSEEKLAQSQKLEAIGRLAGGVAHDFNNLLTTIIGYSDLLLSENDIRENVRDDIGEIRTSAERAASLTQQLLAFSRKQVLQVKIIDLNSLVRDLEKMLKRLIGENIILKTILDSRLGNIKADPGQIEQVIINLVINARDAMPRGGKITIESKNVFLEKKSGPGQLEVVTGNYVLLSVSDTGHGIDKETQRHIFEPFFTTKKAGKGTGLGLSTAYGIVKQSKGYIWLYSEPGLGTSFKIYLPAIEKPVEKEIHQTDQNDIESGDETMLLVEDDRALREMANKILKIHGYRVIEASNGIDALRSIMNEGWPRIDLLVTDVIMPEMSGKDLSEKLLNRYTELKVLYISGYTDNIITHYGILDVGLSFLQKPFSAKSLARKVRSVLDSK